MIITIQVKSLSSDMTVAQTSSMIAEKVEAALQDLPIAAQVETVTVERETL